VITNNIILLLAFLGLFQAVFLCFYLFTLKKGNRKSNILLALVLLGLTIRVSKSVVGYYVPLEAWQRNIGIAGVFISGPCLWFYGVTLFEKNKAFTNWNYLHFFPFVFFVSMFTVIPSDGEFATFWNYGLVVLYLFAYLVLSSTYLLKKKSDVSHGVVVWYRNILIGVTLVWLYYLVNFLNINPHYISGPIFYTFLIYAFSYLFLNRHNFSLEKYGSSSLDRNMSRDVFQRIKMLFNDEHVFLDSDISLNAVAEKLTISPRLVSQAINENEQQNFHEFVNQYRIENAKTLLIDSKNIDQKIATIAFDAGFGTVTSFNVAFKKKTGMTPSEYRKQHDLR
jgi:AraC-like DNA-binding protein